MMVLGNGTNCGEAMTESEWEESADPAALLQHAGNRASRRKRWLFACACCQEHWQALPESHRDWIRLAELCADGSVTEQELVAARLAWETKQAGSANQESRASYGNNPSIAASLLTQGEMFLMAAVAAAALEPTTYRWQASQRLAQARILRHLMGSPFRRPPALATWPAAVVHLAGALYAREDCSFALRDALLEAGQTELADHFLDKDHPKGCWAVDRILGKT
jgi:hypothetical protein